VSYVGNDRLKDDNEQQKADNDPVDLVSYAGNDHLKDDNEQPES
jgi:hypothetical protein